MYFSEFIFIILFLSYRSYCWNPVEEVWIPDRWYRRSTPQRLRDGTGCIRQQPHLSLLHIWAHGRFVCIFSPKVWVSLQCKIYVD